MHQTNIKSFEKKVSAVNKMTNSDFDNDYLNDFNYQVATAGKNILIANDLNTFEFDFQNLKLTVKVIPEDLRKEGRKYYRNLIKLIKLNITSHKYNPKYLDSLFDDSGLYGAKQLKYGVEPVFQLEKNCLYELRQEFYFTRYFVFVDEEKIVLSINYFSYFLHDHKDKLPAFYFDDPEDYTYSDSIESRGLTLANLSVYHADKIDELLSSKFFEKYFLKSKKLTHTTPEGTLRCLKKEQLKNSCQFKPGDVVTWQSFSFLVSRIEVVLPNKILYHLRNLHYQALGEISLLVEDLENNQPNIDFIVIYVDKKAKHYPGEDINKQIAFLGSFKGFDS